MLTIKDLHVGDEAKIKGFSQCDPHYRQKLLAMGLLPGSVIKLTCVAPLGDPVQIVIRGSVLSLRKSEASVLKLEKIAL
ncbi:MAG: ferrous iron transport protein A [Gammaproteobacteria bacterium]|nr:ferrous iron transport protein A [Gammaproteobacteria bacterium]